MFRKRHKPGRPADGATVYHGLRTQLLDLDPASAGLGPTQDRTRLWGAMMETGYPAGVATVVSLADGTTSLYTSSGFGIIGGGAHQAVVGATRAFLAIIEQYLGDLSPEPDPALPATGLVTIRALTYAGRLSASASADDLGHGRHRLAPVFHASHGVLTQLRLVDQARQQS